jgi:hypothetical protein
MSKITPQEHPKVGKVQSSLKRTAHKGFSLKHPVKGKFRIDPVFSLAKNPHHLRLDIECSSSSNLDISSLDYLQTYFNSWLCVRFSKINTKYPLVLDTLLANLWIAHISNSQVITPFRKQSITYRNPDKIGYDVLKTTITFLAEIGLITINKGKPSQFDGIATWCSANSILVHWFELDAMRAKLKDNASFVELHVTNKVKRQRMKRRKLGDGIYESYLGYESMREVETVPIPKRDQPLAKRLSNLVRGYNELWTNHLVTHNDDYIIPWCRRVFNKNLRLGGRFYGPFQNIPKLDRKDILIDTMPTVEPDFGGLHFNLLYAEAGIQFDNDNDDVYTGVGDYPREVIKAVMLPLMNTTKLGTLAGNISTSGKPHIKRMYAIHKRDKEYHDKLSAQGIASKQPKAPEPLKGFINGIPDNTNGHDLIAKLKQRHHAIAHNFGSVDLGIRLQNKDSNIMAGILGVLIAKHIPALPVHDSIRCKISDEAIVRDTMQSQYQLTTGFKISIGDN